MHGHAARAGPVLLVGHVVRPTGMARVMRSLGQALARHRPTHVLATDALPGTDPAASVVTGCTVHANPLRSDIFAEQELARLCASLRPRSVVLYQDMGLMPRLRRAVPEGPVVVGYCPVDGNHHDKIADLLGLTGVAVPTRFAAETVGALMGPETASAIPSLTVIPHGIDSDVFEPMASADRRVAARRALFPERPDIWQGFWIANVNRNHARKRLDLTLRGFARFAADKPADVRLYMNWSTEPTGPNLSQLARRLGIEKRLVFSPRPQGLSLSELNLLYNAADVGVNTSLREGWGLPAFEHALTLAPQIVPAHSACRELWAGCAALLPTRPISSPADWIGGGEVNTDDMAAALERLYRDPGWYGFVAEAGRQNALKSAYRWPRVAATWHAWLSCLEETAHPCDL